MDSHPIGNAVSSLTALFSVETHSLSGVDVVDLALRRSVWDGVDSDEEAASSGGVLDSGAGGKVDASLVACAHINGHCVPNNKL